MLRTYPAAFGLILAIFCWLSCNKEEPIPGYVYIPNVSVETIPNSQGTADQDIPEVWVSVGNRELGVFPLPATVPIIASGDTKVSIRPGIHENGILSTSAFYPFLNEQEFSIDIQPNSSDTVMPVFKYDQQAQFVFKDDFDFGHLFSVDLDDDPSTTMSITQDGFEKAAGMLHVNTTNPIIGVTFEEYIKLPFTGVAAYIEMNYKADNELFVSLGGKVDGMDVNYVPILGLRANSEWRKIYIPLTNWISQSQLDGYRIAFGMSLSQADIDAGLSSTAYIDNVKIIRY